METGDEEIAPVEKALRDNPPVPLIDVTRPHQVDVSFAAIKRKTMRLPVASLMQDFRPYDQAEL